MPLDGARRENLEVRGPGEAGPSSTEEVALASSSGHEEGIPPASIDQ